MTDPTIRWNDTEFRRTFQSWDGPVGKDVRAKMRRIETLAVLSAGFDTGRLVESIDSRFLIVGGNLVGETGANPGGVIRGYALYHHEGTAPHRIAARNAPNLVFPDRRTGRGMVYRKSVQHPGTRANPYLTSPLREVIR